MTIEIIIDGSTQTVSKRELFDLAANGTIGPQTPVSIDGKLITADKIKGIVFDAAPSDMVELIDDAPNVLPKTMANTPSSHNIASGIKKRCGHWGCTFTALGFAIPVICSLIAGFNPVSGPSLFIFWACIVFGGFFLTVGPVLLVVWLVLPATEPEKHEQDNQGPSQENIRHWEENRSTFEEALKAATVLYLTKEYDEALYHCDVVVEAHNPDIGCSLDDQSKTIIAQAYLLRAKILENQEDVPHKSDRIINDCSEAIRLDGNCHEARLIRGKALQDKMKKKYIGGFNEKRWAIWDFSKIPADDANYEEAQKILHELESKATERRLIRKNLAVFKLVLSALAGFVLLCVILAIVFWLSASK